jgi:Tol biopolymer transport system component
MFVRSLIVACLTIVGGFASPPDPKIAALAKEVASRGWIVFAAPTATGDWDLFVMRPDGSRLRNITNTPDVSEMGARFSPDSKRILYRSIRKGKKIPHDRWGAMGTLTIANSDGSNPAVYGGDGEFPWASWSPDGTQVACLKPTGIEIVDLATKKVIRTMDRKGIYQQFLWSPDGKWFTGPANFYGENWTILRMNASTGEVNPVSKFQTCTPDWFPNSQRLVFSSRPANQEVLDGGKSAAAIGQKDGYGWTQLWMADADGNNKSLVYGEDGRHIYGGDISPDGKYVLFARSTVDGIANQRGAPMGLMRLSDAPTIGGESLALRKKYPGTKDGPVLQLPDGWEPHWTYKKELGAK